VLRAVAIGVVPLTNVVLVLVIFVLGRRGGDANNCGRRPPCGHAINEVEVDDNDDDDEGSTLFGVRKVGVDGGNNDADAVDGAVLVDETTDVISSGYSTVS
jgi:hypothetical protein